MLRSRVLVLSRARHEHRRRNRKIRKQLAKPPESVDARNADVRKQRLLLRRAQTVYPLLQRIKQRVYVCCVFQFFNSLL